MIRYPIGEAELLARIAEESRTWLDRAEKHRERCRDSGRYEDGGPDWSEVKPVYMALQHYKCAYCERMLEGPEYGRIEHDVEHFRPKSSVAEWPGEEIASTRGLSYGFSLGEASAQGYYLLAHHPLNYAAACKPCNTPLKSNFFPIAGTRDVASGDVRALAAELPYLIYPAGDVDDDPRELLAFEGILCVPRSPDGHEHWRGRVTIDFFDLNERETLWRQRAEVITAIYAAMLVLSNPLNDQARQDAQEIIGARLAEESAHCNCARSFFELASRDFERGAALARAALPYIKRRFRARTDP